METGRIVGGRYEVLRHIGTGGMGEVFLAKDIGSQKMWALKRVTRQEYRLFNIPKHMGIPLVIDRVQEAEGDYMIMEYVEGITMQEYLESKGRVSLEQAVKWARELADILGYLHGLTPAVYHLDIKPSNIMIGKDNSLTLLDLGAAMAADEVIKRGAGLYGTYGYAPPEQKNGKTFCDARSDIYALGMTLSYMVTGTNPAKPPFLAGELESISKDIKKIIQTCTEKEKEKRYQSMKILSEALENISGKNFKKAVIYREKSIFYTAKKYAGLFLITVCLLAGGAGMRVKGEETVRQDKFLIIRNEKGQKVLMQKGAVLPVEETLHFEIPGEHLEHGKVYEIRVELKEHKEDPQP